VSIEENVRLLRRAHETFLAGDVGAATPMFAEDAVWHVPGQGALSGVKRGRDEILGYCVELLGRSGDTLKLDLHDVVGGDDHSVSLLHHHAERGGKVLDQNLVLVVHIRDGRFTEVWELHEDPAEYDAFFA
jgi:ketosteroid isomerase-like protein